MQQSNKNFNYTEGKIIAYGIHITFNRAVVRFDGSDKPEQRLKKFQAMIEDPRWKPGRNLILKNSNPNAFATTDPLLTRKFLIMLKLAGVCKMAVYTNLDVILESGPDIQ